MVKKLVNIIEPQQLVEHLGSTMAIPSKVKLSLYKKSKISGLSLPILEEVYYRGYTIWNKGFKGTRTQFAFDRVNSFIAGGFAADLDRDLIESEEKHTKNSKLPSSRFDGSRELVDNYKKSTPGQTLTVIKRIVTKAQIQNKIIDEEDHDSNWVKPTEPKNKNKKSSNIIIRPDIKKAEKE